jgi:hypothetical protein
MNTANQVGDEYRGKHLLHKKLFLAVESFYFASYCASYLLKHHLHNRPWERRWSVYQRQTGFTLAIVVSYCRPFNGKSTIPGKVLHSFTSKQRTLHAKLIRLRNKIFAHSDVDEFAVKPFKAGDFRFDHRERISLLAFKALIFLNLSITILSSSHILGKRLITGSSSVYNSSGLVPSSEMYRVCELC